jgi:hypothetical protein
MSTRIHKVDDLNRIILGSPYFAYCLDEYAMNMGSMQEFRLSVWKKVEEISELAKDDLGKIISYFEK